MELVAGPPLEEVMEKRGQIPEDEARRWLVDLAEALAHAHEQGILHRDLKPGNIIIEAGHARLLDFGIARAMRADAGGKNLTQEGMLVGTPRYCSPEQALGNNLDARSDLYGLGVIAYRMVSGKVPIEGANAPETLLRQVTMKPLPVAEAVRPGVISPSLARVIDRLLEKSPDDRYPSAQAVADALLEKQDVAPSAHEVFDPLADPPMSRSIESDVTRPIQPKPPAASTTPPEPQNRGLVVLLVVLAVLVVGAALLGQMLRHEPLPPLALETRKLIAHGDTLEAIRRLEDAVEANKRDPALHAALAHAYVVGGRLDDAIPHFRWALKKGPRGFDDAYKKDLLKLATGSTVPRRMFGLHALERLGEDADVLKAAAKILDGESCEDKLAVIQELSERQKKDAIPVLKRVAASTEGCGRQEAQQAIDAIEAQH
jgi:tetratricopeptide (TPR) repeat protein